MAKAGIARDGIAAIGITNQRETTVVWERASGRPIHNAIVWQDRRTADACADAARSRATRPSMSRSAPACCSIRISPPPRSRWLLDNVDGARAAAEQGRLAFGTVDSFLLWRLTGGKVHATDATNAARTLLLDIRSGAWDADLCELFGVPPSLLPEVRDCAGRFRHDRPELFGGADPRSAASPATSRRRRSGRAASAPA